ncbi:hypothetical protein ACJQWK_04184 [Exserohilum turcicum]
MSSESDEHAQQLRKRSRRSNSGEDAAGGKKARGRPRVDTQDATAADRRRTQIRLAQRAYRQRKETTIASLKTQSAQLHSIIEQMNKKFHHLAESTLKSGLLQLNPALAEEFKAVQENFSSLAKSASEAQYDLDEESEHGVERTERQKPCEPELDPQHIGWGYSLVPPVPSKDHAPPNTHFSHATSAGCQPVPTTTADVISSHQFTFGEIVGQTPYGPEPLSDASSSFSSSSHQELPFGLVPLPRQIQTAYGTLTPHVYTASIPTPDETAPANELPTPLLPVPSLPNKSLDPIKTYGFEETTFARRLARTTAEVALHLLTSFNISPVRIDFIFRLFLAYHTVDQLRERFQNVISRNIDEDLDWWDSPFIHLGGTGTHYPRRDAAGNVLQIKNGWTIEQLGLANKRVHKVQSTEDGRGHLTGVDLHGFEGEWFDSHDVQGYLEERYACRLNPRSTFAECLIDIEEDEPTGSHTSTSRQPSESDTKLSSTSHSYTNPATSCASTHASESLYNGNANNALDLDMGLDHDSVPKYPGGFPKLVDHDISFDQTLGLDLAPSFDYGFASNNGFTTDAGMGIMGENLEGLQGAKQARKRSAWLDVTRLIYEIIRGGVCLGRAPGFRREDIDRAVKAALIQ